MYGQQQQQCPNCGGAFEYAGGGQYARCMRCLALFQNQGGQLTPIVVQAPGGGNNPEFNAMFAKNLGFGPPPPGAGMPLQQPQQGGPQNNFAQGTFDMGGGQQVKLTVDGKTPENYLKDKASSMIWGWIIGAVILGLVVLTFVGIGIYVYVVAKDSGAGGGAAGAGPKAATAAAWDGKSTFDCKGNDAVTLTGIKANVAGTAIKASGNCQLTLTGVDITAGTGIEASANAKVTMTGGSITATTNSVVASAAAKVDLTGTKVSGKAKQSGAAKITGAPL